MVVQKEYAAQGSAGDGSGRLMEVRDHPTKGFFGRTSLKLDMVIIFFSTATTHHHHIRTLMHVGLSNDLDY